MLLQFLPIDQRFNVRVTDAGCNQFPAGGFSTTSMYTVYAIRMTDDGVSTDFLMPGSDMALYWVSMAETRIARRSS